MLLTGLIFFICFFSVLSISSIETIIGFKNSSSISLLFFTSLSFNSISFNSVKYFSYSERLLLTFKNFFVCIIFKDFNSIFSFLQFGFSILIYLQKKFKFLRKKNQTVSSDFKRFIKILTQLTKLI